MDTLKDIQADKCFHPIYAKILSKLPLNMNGFKIGSNTDESPFTDRNMENIIRCMEDIKHVFKQIKQCKLNSYTGKHHIERYRDKNSQENTYISNGEFIASMILSGYKYKTPTSLNLEFNASVITR